MVLISIFSENLICTVLFKTFIGNKNCYESLNLVLALVSTAYHFSSPLGEKYSLNYMGLIHMFGKSIKYSDLLKVTAQFFHLEILLLYPSI